MAYSSFSGNFSRATNGNDNSPTLWTYITSDALTTVDTAGYFNALAGKLKKGDLIYCVNNVSPFTAGLGFVKTNTRNLAAVPPVSGVVDVTNFTAIGTINSD